MVRTINIIELNLLIYNCKLIQYDYSFVLFDEVRFSKSELKILEKNRVGVFQVDKISDPMQISNLSPHLEYLLNHINSHGVLLIHDNKDYYFPFNDKVNPSSFIISLFRGFLGFTRKDPIQYANKKYSQYKEKRYNIIHLSDLHIGKKDIEHNIPLLNKSINGRAKHLDGFRFVITGDLKDSPSVKFADDFFAFKAKLDNLSKQETYFVLGNHDVNIKGNVIIPGKREAIDSLGIYPDIKVDDNNKIIYILLNSNVEGALLARGKVGKNQLKSLEAKYNAIKENIDVSKYQKVVLLHHHIFLIKKSSLYKDDSVLKKILYREEFQLLVDAPELIDWLKKEDIKYVLHGHKHIPNYIREEDINVISCGSSTGADLKFAKEDRPVISYNVLSLDKDNPCCLIYFVLGDNNHAVIVYPMK